MLLSMAFVTSNAAYGQLKKKINFLRIFYNCFNKKSNENMPEAKLLNFLL